MNITPTRIIRPAHTTDARDQALTPTQQHVMDYLRTFHRLNDCLPTAAYIAAAFGWASPNAASETLLAIERKGHLVRNELGRLMFAQRPTLLPIYEATA